MCIDPQEVDFGTIKVYDRGEKKLTILSCGEDKLRVVELKVVEGQEWFTVESPTEVPFALAPSESANLWVFAKPYSAGRFKGTLRIFHENPGGLVYVDVRLACTGR